MKIVYSFLVFLFAGLLFGPELAGQACPGCVVNNTCYVPGGGLCPDSLPAATVAQAYSQDVTFYLPKQIDAAPFSGGLLGIVDLLQLRIDAISGLPFGLNWSCNMNSNNCTYFPSSNDTLGCVKICGTPVGNPGVYAVTIYVTATVDAGILGAQQAQTSFPNVLVLLPDTTSNLGFSMAPGIGCAPLTVTFINNFPSNGYVPIPGQTQGFLYNWDFGNGLQSNIETPPAVTYYAPGQYPVQYTATVDTFGFQLTNVTVTAVNCTDFGSGADVYIKIFDGSNTEIFNNESQQTTSLPFSVPLSINATNPPYRLEVWDDDSGFLGTADDNCYDNTENPHPAVFMNLPQVSALGATTQYFTSGNTPLAFNYTYTKNVFQVQVSDTVTVFPVPPVQSLVLQPGSSVCSPDSIQMRVSPGYGYEWFYNDTMLLAGAITEVAFAKQTGNYKVRVFDLNTGCYSFSHDTLITVAPGIPSNFAVLQNPPGTLNSSISGFYSFQWIFQSGSNWVAIPAPQGQQSTYNPPIAGYYGLIAVNPEGCSDTAFFNYNGTSIEALDARVSLYPNPATEGIHIRIDGSDVNRVRVLDFSGRILWEQEWLAGISQLDIPLLGWQSGYYVAVVEGAVGRRALPFVKVD
jgi:hypothetical protein